MRERRNRKHYINGNGFTLIELLVVIAIVSMLASVIVVSLNTTRNKGKFAAVQSNLNTVRSESELYYVGSSTYGTPITDSALCDSDIFNHSVINAAIVEATKNGSSDANSNRRCVIGANGQSWAVSIPLSDGGNWCVGSVGAGGSGIASGGGALAPAFCDSDAS
ncbi:MAG: type II secretion system protein [Patescibacteria group bacterium]